ncbi:30S ribosomal protein S21 [Candidatus Gottesmanbacteria bacterium RIFCSPLOWO2_01_FULL_49_10]|uniref:Small ribosomal subunit protein bS21 n=1 Tax=Candidatus Gottesmanbacteria bacterium RIFCSPLOWO2_01_FULL_49_10 TaxID=1798396 RepID=A0A1F6B2E5_9BACT|nr:MAG: 30S ribosomal protein S21 [Candidatus Gottesmanbacteria bacterium RIFCSPLOWO2_01_FULL_49_10]
MVFVKAQPGDTSDSLIRKFTRKVLAEGILQDLKKREFYQKPAEIRKEKKRDLIRRLKHPRRV